MARLSTPAKGVLAASFGKQIARLAPPQLTERRTLIEGQLLPLPDDLNAMLVTQLERLDPHEAATARPPALVQ